MTSKERVIAAMSLRQPDRVPLMCQFSIGSMMNQLKPDPVAFWYDMETFANGLIELAQRFHFDGILVSLHGHSDDWKKDLLSTEALGEGKVRLRYSDRTELHSWEDLPLVQYLTPVARKASEEVDVMRDIPAVLDYIPVSSNLYFRLNQAELLTIFDYLYSKVGDSLSIHGEVTSPFDYLLDLLGYEDGLVAMIMDPDKCKEILQRFTDLVVDLAVKMCQKPIDAIKVSSPFAGMGFISSEFYQEFVLPYERQLASAIRAAGKHVYIHTCGSITDRLELMEQCGISGLECLDPPPVGNVDLEDAFERVGKSLFIKGNIDSVNTLLMGDDKKVHDDVKRIIETGKRSGRGFILSTACSIAPHVSKERLLKLSDLVAQYGVYA